MGALLPIEHYALFFIYSSVGIVTILGLFDLGAFMDIFLSITLVRFPLHLHIFSTVLRKGG